MNNNWEDNLQKKYLKVANNGEIDTLDLYEVANWWIEKFKEFEDKTIEIANKYYPDTTKDWNERHSFIGKVGEIFSLTHKIDYDISEWKRRGIERGYWAYFKDEIRKEILDKLSDSCFPPKSSQLEDRSRTINLEKIKEILK